jgi:hypothetical protein
MVRKLILSDQREEIRRLAEAYIQSGNVSFLVGSGASVPTIKLAGNIESQINGLLLGGNNADADLMAFEFIEEMAEINADLVANIENAEIATTLNHYVEFLSVVDAILFERKNILLPRQANIFTTNYDVFFEKAASLLQNVTMNDGFDRSSAIDSSYRFSPEIYFDRTFRSGNVYNRLAELPVFNLIKVHGSFTWMKHEEGIRFASGGVHLSGHVQKNNPSDVEAALKTRALILPNIRKFESTVLDRVYFDLLRLFSNSMERENALLIVFGFSFADEHILDITRRALRNPTSQVIIFSYDGQAASDFDQKFKQQRNVMVVAPDDNAVIDFAVFNSLLREIGPSGSDSDG